MTRNWEIRLRAAVLMSAGMVALCAGQFVCAQTQPKKVPSVPAAAPAPVQASPYCMEAMDRLDALEKEVSFAKNFDSVGDNSAPRETNRLLNVIAIQQRQQMVLSESIAAGCPAPPKELLRGGDAYMSNVLSCRLAALKKEAIADVCDKTKWKRSDSAAQLAG